MFPSPAGLNPVDGIAMRAQTILHREILHLQGLLILAISLLRTRFAILSPSCLDFVTSPHLQVQIRGLDSAIRQATQAIQTGVHYIQELLTTFGMIHTLNCDTAHNWMLNYVDARLSLTLAFPLFILSLWTHLRLDVRHLPVLLRLHHRFHHRGLLQIVLHIDHWLLPRTGLSPPPSHDPVLLVLALGLTLV